MGWKRSRAWRVGLVVVIAIGVSLVPPVGVVDHAVAAEASLTIDRVTTTRGDERVTGVVAGQPVELHLAYTGLGSGIHDLTIRDANSGAHILNTSVVGDAGSAAIGISGSALSTAYAAGPDTIELVVEGRGTTSTSYSMDKVDRATVYLTDVPPRADQDDPITVSYYGWTHETVDLTLAVDHPPLTDNTGEDEAIQSLRITPPSGGSRPYVFSGDLTFTPSDFRESPDDPAIRIQLRESMTPGPTTFWGNGEWIRITNDPPVADFSYAPRQPRVNQPVSFDASSSADPDGRIERYAWDFNGDGTTDATGQVTNHTFQTSDDHTVALTVTDDGGSSTTLRIRVPVIASPTASFRVHPDDPVTDRPVTFDASTSTDPDGRIDRYAWDLDGDGRTDETGRIINHTYGSPGTFTVSLAVTDDDGATNSTTKRVSVDQLVPPTANLAFSPDVPSVNDTTRFDAEGSTDPDGPIVRYVWTFGDGTNLTTADPVAEHTFTRGGTYTATVTVVDEDAARDTARATVRVNRPPAVEVTASPAEPRRDQPLTVDASGSRDPDGTITSYDWTFGDGTVVTDGPATVTHRYTAFGTYTVAVTVEDDDGARRTATVEIPVENRPPDAAFSFSPFRPKPGRGVQFDASRTSDPDGQVVEYRWDFDGDGEIDATGGPEIVHTFADRGRVTVRLVAVDDAGATNVTSTRITVGSTLPLLEFLILVVLGLWVILFLWLSGALPDRVTDIGFRGRAERLPDLDIDIGEGSTADPSSQDEDLTEDFSEESHSQER